MTDIIPETWLLANPRRLPGLSDDESDAAIDQWIVDCHDALASAEGFNVEKVVASRDDFKATAASLGGFKGWIGSLAGRDPWSGKERYHVLVVPLCDYDGDLLAASGFYPVVGKATAGIIDSFKEAGKDVFLWIPDTNEFLSVIGWTAMPLKDNGKQDWIRFARIDIEVGEE